jgi:hypothetical protein
MNKIFHKRGGKVDKSETVFDNWAGLIRRRIQKGKMQI